MRRMFLLCFFMLFTIVYAKNDTKSDQIIEISKIKDVEGLADDMALRYGDDTVCMVYDLDNTIITNEPFYGSESWSHWVDSNDSNYSENLLKSGQVNKYDFYDSIRYMINYKPVETSTLSTIEFLQNKYPTIGSTSRGFQSDPTTKLQLSRNGFDFKKNPIGVKGDFDNSYLGLNSYKNGYTMYVGGIQYTSGGNKGVFLQSLILKERSKTGNAKLCQSIVFVDDTLSKVEDVKNALQGKFNLSLVHYTYLPDPENPKNWHPESWSKATKDVSKMVESLNPASV